MPAPANNIHTKVERDSGSVRGYAALVPAELAMRYGPEAARDSMRMLKPGFLRTIAQTHSDVIRDYIYHDKIRPEAEEMQALDKARRCFTKYFVGDSAESATEQLTGYRAKVVKCLESDKLLPTKHREAIEKMLGGLKNAVIRDKTAFYSYDLPIGVLSAALSYHYNQHVAHNMHNLFAEAVGYETGKDATSITRSDLSHSDNPIVRGTLSNLHWKEFQRYGTDAIFGGRLLGMVPGLSKASALPFGAAGIASKAVLVFSENLRHEQTTLYEDLVALAETKLNPTRGIARPVEVAELASLYQKYTLKYAKDKSLKDAMSAQNSDTMNWAEAEPIFERMAALMNLTYKYKYDMVKEAPKPGEVADFTLPKLIYLLGHGMIDPYKPKQTLAFVEVANRYGIEAVKALSTALEQGQPLDAALVANPVDLSALKHSLPHEQTTQTIEPPTTIDTGLEHQHMRPVRERAIA